MDVRYSYISATLAIFELSGEGEEVSYCYYDCSFPFGIQQTDLLGIRV